MLALNNKRIPLERYYGGEWWAALSKTQENNEILWLCDEHNHLNELFILQALVTTLHDEGVNASLLMPYIPYSRQDHFDRTIDNDAIMGGDTVRLNTLKTLVNSINAMSFKKVTVCEPHSDVAPFMLDRCRVMDVTQPLVNAAIKRTGCLCTMGQGVLFIFPDGGASKRYRKDPFYANRPWTEASKDRDRVTGEFTGYRLMDDITDKGYHTAIIVDDLCSAGGTFVNTAEPLRAAGIEKIYLVVAHCENNIQNGKILSGDLIDTVITTDSILTYNHPKIEVAYEFAKGVI